MLEMKQVELCQKKNCTGCGACAFICPKQCISMKENHIGIIYPDIDETCCVHCGNCSEVCPQIHRVAATTPRKAFAAWSTDPEQRRTSASGGIAAELYQAALEAGYQVVGAKSEPDFSVTLQLSSELELIKAFKNSKYVFSSADPVYPAIKKAQADGQKVLMIGLPCQIAAVKNLFPDRKNLVLVDVVCHGVTPYSYLRQHIEALENAWGEKTAHMSFRDAVIGTPLFVFTLYNHQDNRFYAKRTKDGDTYQYGYHRMISYRENCYHCIYANMQRVSDITLSDYKGLGKMAPCDFTQQKVSSVLVHSERGAEFIRKLITEGRIFAEERPLMEPIQGDLQLQHPSEKKKTRKDFECFINKYNGDFERAMQDVIRREQHRQKLQTVRKVLRLPARLTKAIKHFADKR